MLKQSLQSFIVLLGILLLSACGGSDSSPQNETPGLLGGASYSQTSLPLLNKLENFDNSGQARSVLAENNLLYVADGSFGLNILNVSSDNEFDTVGSFSVSAVGRAYDVEKNGDYIYLAARKDGLVVIDVSNPVSPQSNLSIISPNPTDATKVIEPSYLYLQGNKLYVSAGIYFLIYDVSNSSTPVEIGRYVASSPNQRAIVSGNFAYVAGYGKGLRIIDVTSPASLQLVSETGVSYNTRAVEKVGNIIFLGGDDSGLLYLDITNPAEPVLLGELELPSGTGGETAPYDLLVWSDFLFIADGDAGVQVVGITNPRSPVLGSNIATLDSSNGLFVDGTDLYLADYDFIQLIEIFETTDRDGDGVVDGADVFPDDANENADNDNDGEGDNADIDDDNDTVLDINDAFPFDPTETVDSDGDGVGDNSDAFPNDSNESVDFDGDGIGDNADLDDDNDGIADAEDAFPTDEFNMEQITFDGELNGYAVLDGDQIAWRGYPGKVSPTVYFQDLVSGQKIDLGAGIDGYHGIPSLSKGQVAWQVWDKVASYRIYFWDGASTSIIAEFSDGGSMPGAYTNKTRTAPPLSHFINVSLDNGAIAWSQWNGDGDGDGNNDGSNYEIMYWDGSSITAVTTTADENDYDPDLNNGQITWTGDEAAGSSTDVFLWDGLSTVTNVSNSPDVIDDSSRLVNGRLVWSSLTSDIVFKRDTYVWDGSVITILPLAGHDYTPQSSESNSFVVSQNRALATAVTSLYVWDGFVNEKMDMPQFSKVINPSANLGRVAFTGTVASEPDIYIASYRIDKDEDGVVNGADAFPLDPAESVDTDLDGIGNNADNDDDNDGVLDGDDFAPLDVNEAFDTDGDGVGDNADFFPTDPTEDSDDDLDGEGNNTDVSYNFSLTEVDSIIPGGQVRSIYKDGKYLYVADGTNGLQIYELLIDGSFQAVGTSFKLDAELGVDVSARAVEKVGNYLYIAYREKGLYVVDITDPENPVQVFNYDTPDRASFIEISGSRLYLSDRFGLLIFDISNPASPVYLGDYDPPLEIERVLAEGNLLYAALYYNGVLILDVTDAADPTVISITPIPDLLYVDEVITPERSPNFGIWTVEKDGNYLYVGGENSGLIVLDITNLTKPVEITRLDLPDVNDLFTTLDQPPLKMQKYGTQLFVADGINGLQVVDISDPLNPSITTDYQTPSLSGTLWDFHIDGYTMLTGDHFGGMQHLNLSGATLDNDGDLIPNYLDPNPNE